MQALLDLSFSRSRTVLLVLAFVTIAGGFAYLNIPKESEPDIAIPIIYVSMTHDGISPEDAERLLAACPDAEWRLLVGLSRYGGLRCESEVLRLTWSDVLWDQNKLVIHASNDALNSVAQGRLVAAGIPGAEYHQVESNNHVPLPSDPVWQEVVAAQLEFIQS